jgi:hypothetical protein
MFAANWVARRVLRCVCGPVRAISPLDAEAPALLHYGRSLSPARQTACCRLRLTPPLTCPCRSRVPKYIPDFREAFDHFCLHAGGWMGGQGIRGQGCMPPASVQLRHSPGPPGILSLACGLNLAPAFPCNLCTTPMHRAGGRGVVEGLSKQLGLTPRQMEPSANTLHWCVVGLWWASGVKRASTRCFFGGSQRACARHTVPCLTCGQKRSLLVQAYLLWAGMRRRAGMLLYSSRCPWSRCWSPKPSLSMQPSLPCAASLRPAHPTCMHATLAERPTTPAGTATPAAVLSGTASASSRACRACVVATLCGRFVTKPL